MIQIKRALVRAFLIAWSGTMDSGVVYVVATPIGHLEDISARAIKVLGSVDLVAAEDTRRTRVLLRHFGISTPVAAYHAHNEHRAVARLLEQLQLGRDIALVSDAGTPCLSDPGRGLIDACHRNGIRVVPVPGASAILAALCAAGLDNSRFMFEGFIGRDGKARRQRLASWRSVDHAIVLFESPTRMCATIDELIESVGPAREALLARELTKLHEQLRRAPLAELRRLLQEGVIPLLGEFVLVLAPAPKSEHDTALVLDAEAVLRHCGEYLSPSQASRLAARLTGRPRAELYALAQRLMPRVDASDA